MTKESEEESTVMYHIKLVDKSRSRAFIDDQNTVPITCWQFLPIKVREIQIPQKNFGSSALPGVVCKQSLNDLMIIAVYELIMIHCSSSFSSKSKFTYDNVILKVFQVAL